jgi:predicted nucleotidyltransferase
MDEALKKQIVAAAREYETEGFRIVGVFGSRARGDSSAGSDLDLLCRLEYRFLGSYPGWAAYERIDMIKDDLVQRLGLSIDVADLDDIGRKFILPEIVYVS